MHGSRLKTCGTIPPFPPFSIVLCLIKHRLRHGVILSVSTLKVKTTDRILEAETHFTIARR
jgi:hypothetical protein